MTKGERAPSAAVAWSVTVVIFLATVAGGIGLILDRWWLFYAGCAGVVVGVVYGRAVRLMEYTEEATLTRPGEIEPETTKRHG